MATQEIGELQRIFLTRLDALSHMLDVGERHFSDIGAVLQERLAPDMFPLGTQIAVACNQPRGFSQWCAGNVVENLGLEVTSTELARSHIDQTRELVAGVKADDSKLEEVRRVNLGHDMYCELPSRQYVNDYVIPNFYFHITTAYAILRKLGVPLGKADYMPYLAPYVKHER